MTLDCLILGGIPLGPAPKKPVRITSRWWREEANHHFRGVASWVVDKVFPRKSWGGQRAMYFR